MEVRFIPMDIDDEEFVNKDIKHIQNDFFEGTLIKDYPIGTSGWYNFRKKGLVAEEDDLLLFQIQNKIIASAKLKDTTMYAKTSKEHIDGYRGAYILKRNTIKVFKPISYEELSKIIQGLEKFDMIKKRIYENQVNMLLLEERMLVPNE